MTAEAQQIAIAEACGWTPSPNGQYTRCPSGLNGPFIECPDYLNDLNAMHGAEMTLDELQRCQFCDKLFRVLVSGDGVTEFDKIHATAAQRAEAFLRTIGKWEAAK